MSSENCPRHKDGLIYMSVKGQQQKISESIRSCAAFRDILGDFMPLDGQFV